MKEKRKAADPIERRGTTTDTRLAATGGAARLIMLEGPARGSKFTVEDGMTFGRGKAASVFLDAPDISRVHARIRTGDRHVVEDLGSRNGTFVNGIPVEDATPLRFGDRVRIGGRTILLFTRFDPAEEELRQRQRLGLLGRIAAGVVHDVNNLLGVILSTQDFLLDTPGETPLGDGETRDCLIEVRAAAERAAQLMPKLLNFARGQSDGYRPFDLSSVCEEVVHVAQRTFDRRIVIETHIEPGLMVVGDRVEIHQVIMNLCVNARDAIAAGGTLRLTARRSLAASSDDGGSMQAPVAEISVQDTGEGIDEATLERIFEPFFTTKTGDRGSGLGLATAKEMIAVHRGQISVKSQEGEGTTFVIELPLDTGAQSVTTLTLTPYVSPGSLVVQILLVDDDPMCRKAFSRLLMRAGHRVTAVAGGLEALEWIRDAQRLPDLVLLDVDMPNLSGEETQRRLREIYPEIRVVAITGNRSTERQQAMLAGGAVDLVPKPFTQEQLLAAVQSAVIDADDLVDPEATRPATP